MSILLLVVSVDIPTGRTERTIGRFDRELNERELLLNCFIAFLETYPVSTSFPGSLILTPGVSEERPW